MYSIPVKIMKFESETPIRQEWDKKLEKISIYLIT